MVFDSFRICVIFSYWFLYSGKNEMKLYISKDFFGPYASINIKRYVCPCVTVPLNNEESWLSRGEGVWRDFASVED